MTGAAPDDPAACVDAQLDRALELSLRFLGPCDRTVAEVRRHLLGRRIDPDTVDRAVCELGRQDYLDDGRFARRYAEERRARHDWGPERIERRLLASGVDAELVAAVLATRDSAEELDAAMALLRRRFPAPPATDRERNRALALLMRKGFELELAYDAVREVSRPHAA